MNIRLYKSRENNFNNNGVGVFNELLKLEEKEEVNGVKEIDCVLSINDNSKLKIQRIQKFQIIEVNKQLYRIYNIKTDTFDDTLSISARHIFFDLQHYDIDSVVWTGSGRALLEDIFSRYNDKYELTFNTKNDYSVNIQVTNTNILDIFFTVIKASDWEFKRDNFKIEVNDGIGKKNNKILVMKNKNLTGLNMTENLDGLVTRIIPVGQNGVTIPNRYIDSPLINLESYPPFPITKQINFNTEDILTLQMNAERYIHLVDKPNINIKAQMQDLSKLEEFKDFEFLYKIDIGDYIILKDKELNYSTDIRVISLTKDLLNQVNNKVELGSFKRNLFDLQEEQVDNIVNKSIIDTKNQLNNIIWENNPAEININNMELLCIYKQIEVNSNVNLRGTFSVVAQSYTEDNLEIKIMIDDINVPTIYKQKLEIGFNTISIPIIIPKLQAGGHTMYVFLKTQGNITVEPLGMQLILDGLNIVGGINNTPPMIYIIDNIPIYDFNDFNPLTNASITLTYPPIVDIQTNILIQDILEDRIIDSTCSIQLF